jgi:hypothetical protein
MKLRWLALASCALTACTPRVQLGDHLTDAASEGGGSSSGAGDAAAAGMCDGSGSTAISVDIYNTSLSGSFAPAYAARDELSSTSASPIGKRDSDVMCLVDVDFTIDITGIIAAGGPTSHGGSGAFPYSYWVQTSVSTPFTNPETQDGSVPPPPPGAPCGAVPPNVVNNAFQCMIQNCNLAPGDPSGNLLGNPATGTDCIKNHCAGALGPILLNTSYNACFDCIVDYVVSDQPYGASQAACMNNVQSPFGFGGQVPLVILSRYPLSDGDAFILPSTNFRQAALFSRVHLPSCKTVDFYCGFFTSPLTGQELPYTGNYGAGGDPNSTDGGGAYAHEQLLQAQRLAQWVQQKSGSNPAIVVGDWRSSPGAGDAGVLQALVPETVNLLSGTPGWTAVSAPQWTPQCTYCPQSDNPLNVGQTAGYFMTQPFLYNWPQASTAVQLESVIFTQTFTAVGFPDAGEAAPLSTNFGLNLRIVGQ